MAPVYQKNLVPLLISSVWADDANSILKKLPMNSRAIKGAVASISCENGSFDNGKGLRGSYC